MFYSRHPFVLNYLRLKWNGRDIIDQRMCNKRLSEVIYTKLIPSNTQKRHAHAPSYFCTKWILNATPQKGHRIFQIALFFYFTWGWFVHRAHVTIFTRGLLIPFSEKDSWVCAVALAVTVVSSRHGLFFQAPITVLFLKGIETSTLCAYRNEDGTRCTRSIMRTSSNLVFWAKNSFTTLQLRLYGGTKIKFRWIIHLPQWLSNH